MLVACGVIRREGKILIAQRKPTSRLEPLKWEFPGGKIEFGENPPDTLRREIREELDFDIAVGKILCVSSHTCPSSSPPRHLLMLAYECVYASGTPAPRDVHDFRWIQAEDLGAYDFAAADLPVIEAIRGNRPSAPSGGERSDAGTSVSELKGEVARFVAERDWAEFHSPKNLSMSITIEAAELMEHFQWLTVEESRRLPADPVAFDAIGQEVADVAMYVLSLCNSLQLDLSDAIIRKLKLNRKKYPVDKYRGKHTA
jgi:mutator protein MutT